MYSGRENDAFRALLVLDAQDEGTPSWWKAWRRYCAAIQLLKSYH